MLFQRRHLFAHSEGIVDAKYISNTGDMNYKEGQRLIVVGNDIQELARILSKLGAGIRKVAT